MTGGRPQRFRFGVFEFNAETGELFRDGAPVKLQSQPARVLGLLLSQAPETVTRDTLQQAVWGAETFVDFDRGLNFCISQIRSALGDSADSPRYVRTIPKQGYKFIAPVEVVGATEIVGQAPRPARDAHVPPSPVPPTAAVPRIGALVLALVLVIALAFALRTWSTRSSPPKIAILHFDNETGDPTFDRFADTFTDSLVAELTAAVPRLAVIGNAAELRVPRPQRDLRKIAGSLNASHIVLGQVLRNGTGIRVLAHLIRMPDQTHLTVSRQDLESSDPSGSEATLARNIAADFARRLDASRAPSIN